MKNRYIVLGLALVSSLALAQVEGGSTDSVPTAGGKPPHMARMEDKLGLTDEQVQKMREIRDSGGSMQEMHAVLTPEQQAKAAAMRNEHMGDRKAQMQKYLGLSDEQVGKMAEIRQEGGSREEMRAVLTPEQQAKFDTMRSKHGGNSPGSEPDSQN